MSRTLTLIHAGWAAVRGLATSGRRADALTGVKRLLARPDLPAAVAADANRLAGELLIEGERFGNARRHLRAAAGLEPNHARTHYLIGVAFERDPHGDDRRAAVRYRKAAELEPGNALYRAAFGRAAVRAGAVKTGVRALLAAAGSAPENIPVVRVVTDGLVEAGRVDEARGVLVKARLLSPQKTELGGLWERVRFETARLGQQNRRQAQEAHSATEGAVLLPLLRVVGSAAGRTPGTPTVRRDHLSKPRPHLARLRSTKADR